MLKGIIIWSLTHFILYVSETEVHFFAYTNLCTYFHMRLHFLTIKIMVLYFCSCKGSIPMKVSCVFIYGIHFLYSVTDFIRKKNHVVICKLLLWGCVAIESYV